MKVSKFKVLLYLKKSNLDKQGKHLLWDALPSITRTCSLARARTQWHSSHANCPVIPSYGTLVLADWMENHVVTFDKSLHEYYTKFFAVQSGKAERSDFHAQFRMVSNNYN